MLAPEISSGNIASIEAIVTGKPRTAPEGMWMIGGGIETPCKYLIYADMKLKSKITHLCLLNFLLLLPELEKPHFVMKRMKKNNNKNIWAYIWGGLITGMKNLFQI